MGSTALDPNGTTLLDFIASCKHRREWFNRVRTKSFALRFVADTRQTEGKKNEE